MGGRAVDEYGMELFLEPVFVADYDGIGCYRAQVRIHDPQLGVLLPADYMPVAERTKQCIRIGLWSVEAVLECIRKMQRRDIIFDWISVYLPLRMLEEPEFAAGVAQQLREMELDGRKLAFEFSCDLLRHFTELMEYQVESLHREGVRIILREFGAEHCVTSRLCRLPVDICMLDASVPELLSGDGRERKMAESLIQMIQMQEIPVAACEVALDSQRRDMLEFGCSYLCGKSIGTHVKQEGIRNR